MPARLRNLPVRQRDTVVDRHEDSGRELAEPLGRRLDPPGDDTGQRLDDPRVVFVGHPEPQPFERVGVRVDVGARRPGRRTRSPP